MNVARELRNEATGKYGRQPAPRYQTLLCIGSDHIEKLEAENERLRALITAWVDADLRRLDMTRPNEDLNAAVVALREAVGR